MLTKVDRNNILPGKITGKLCLGILLCVLFFQGFVFSGEVVGQKENTAGSVPGIMKDAVRSSAIYIGKRFVEAKILYLTREYEQLETEHFTVRYRREDKKWAEIIGNAQEDSYRRLVSEFGFELDRKMVVVVYPDSQAFIKIHFPEAEKSPMGLYYAGTIGILSPGQWAEDEDKFHKEGPVLHELVHAFVDIKTKGKYPLWFTEGVALYYENKITGFEWGKGLAIKSNGISQTGNIASEQSMLAKTIYRLDTEFDSMDQDLAYRRSFEVIKSIVNKHGETKLLDIMDELSKDRSILEVLSGITL